MLFRNSWYFSEYSRRFFKTQLLSNLLCFSKILDAFLLVPIGSQKLFVLLKNFTGIFKNSRYLIEIFGISRSVLFQNCQCSEIFRIYLSKIFRAFQKFLVLDWNSRYFSVNFQKFSVLLKNSQCYLKLFGAFKKWFFTKILNAFQKFLVFVKSFRYF